MTKPYCGKITEWQLIKGPHHCTILGKAIGHPRKVTFYDGAPITTSKVVSLKWNKNGTVTCYTLDSCYTLI